MVIHKLHYLTVQDLLWINLQVTGAVHEFDFARLEDGAFYQYGYGKSTNLLLQAARFYPGFAKMKGFETGNEATAFVAFAAFLLLNGRRLTLKDAATSIEDFPRHESKAVDWVERNTAAEPHHDHAPLPQEAITTILGQYPKLITALAK